MDCRDPWSGSSSEGLEPSRSIERNAGHRNAHISRPFLFFFIIFISSLLILAGVVWILCRPSRAPSEAPRPTTPPHSYPSKNYIEQPEPKTGHIFKDISGRDHLAPLTIQTSSARGCYVVLDPISFDTGSSKYEATKAELDAKYSYIKFYVRASSEVEVLVPIGEYEIYYATGQTWYGEDGLFGADTTYYKCDDTFLFTGDLSGYDGWTISLSPVSDGNLETEPIDPDEFPS